MTRATKPFLFSTIVLQVICGGVRFVDGSVLLQFSQAGFQAKLQDFSQYLFDSPLKIMFLMMLRLGSAPEIGGVFLLLNFLPFVTILFLSRDRQENLDLLVILSIIPIWKLMFQNIGVGDSIIISGTIVLIVARQWIFVILGAFVMVLWHFQQGALILFIISALCIATGDSDGRARLKSMATGAVLGLLTFAMIETFLVPPHTGRLTAVIEHIGPILEKNLLYLPIALCALVPGTILMVEALHRLNPTQRPLLVITAIGATALAICVGGLTTDFSRVMVLLTFPIVLFLARSRAEPSGLAEELITSRRLVPMLAIGVVSPMVSWSGIDIFLWTRLLTTFHKYHVG